MSRGLPIRILEPVPTEKNRLYADKLWKKTAAAPEIPVLSLEQIKSRLKTIRQYSAENIKPLLEELTNKLADKYPGLNVKVAGDAADAVDHIRALTPGKDTVFTNNSSLLGMELKAALLASGYKIVNSYFNEFEAKEGRIRDYWDLPRMLQEWNLAAQFDLAVNSEGVIEPGPVDPPARDAVLLLGVNAVSAEDGTVFFLEHFNNIRKDIAQAKDIFLVIPLEKIIRTTEEAAFQTRCVGLFGAESMLFEVQAKAVPKPSISGLKMEDMPLLGEGDARNLHVIILDNHRSQILRGRYKDLMLCIGCRACNQRCPARHSFINEDYAWTPRNYLKAYIDGTSKHLDACLHCEGCRLACPLGINIPHMMWEAKLNYVRTHRRPLRHFVLGMAEVVAQAGSTFAPIMNYALKVKAFRWVLGYVPGIHKDIVMPSFEKQTFLQWVKKNNIQAYDYSNSSLIRGLWRELLCIGRRVYENSSFLRRVLR